MHMASTSNKNRATSLGKSDKSSAKRSPKSPTTSKPNKPKGSMGLGLLLIAIGTSLIGLGGLGYFVYQELLSSSRREVDRSAEAQTRQLEAKLTDVQQTVDEVAIASKILLQQQPRPRVAAPFQKIVVESLQNANSVSGMGIASNGNLLFPPAKPLVPYVWKEQSGLKPETSGQKLAAPNDKLLSGDRPDISKAAFYQETLKGKASWSQPYTALGKTIITYSAPISDGQKVVGIVSADAIASEILSVVDTATQKPTEESKIGFVVASSSGKVISASYQFQATETNNPSITQALTSLAQQAKTEPSGIVQTGGYLWAYRKIAGSDLLVATQLPEAEITNKLIVLVGGTAVGISAILAIAILGFVNSLKKRLQPLTEECDRFLSQQGNSSVNIAGKDEIDHLGLSLKSTFQQVKTNEIRLRGELSQSSSSDDISTAAQIQQNFAETELMEAEVGDLLDVVSSMEEGDLTIEAQVNDRATGLVADTLNRLREKLVEIISSVLGTAQQVAQGAADLEELAKTVVLNTAEQAQSVTQGQALTEQVAAIAERSAAQVNVANQSLQEVRDTVASGQTAINTLTDSISVLQTGSAQIVQRMKTLGEFVGLAEQFVQDQGQIASLTQVLALNATLVAARAAEQKDPKQFASVAREFESIAGQVNDLATQTNDGLTVLQQRTSQIQTVVTAIDAEVQNLSGLVAGFTSGVESSQSAFNSIQSATEEVVQIGQTITESSTEIADAAGSTASYISEIAQLADRTADLTRSARQQAEAMGNQAQQLLQGIQFFRLPESSGIANPPNNALTSEAFDSPDPSVNNLFDSSTESSSTEAKNLGFVVPAIAVAATATAVTLSQQEEAYTAEYAMPDDEDNTATDSRYLEDLLDDGISSEFAENHSIELPQEQSFASISENFISEDVLDNQNQDSTVYSDLTDISLIEESLLADLKQEIYNESSLDEVSDTEATLKNPMEGVNEFAIDDASSDPMIVSATSSFLEDTAFGTPSPLAEDANLHLPAFVDFTIPDLDDDFQIPKMNIESSLDDSSSFFDSSTLIQETEIDTSGIDFDPFAMDDQTSMQPLIEANDYAIADEDEILTPLDGSVPADALVDNPDDIADNFEFTEFEDYSQYASNDAINESLEQSLASPSNEAFSDTFDISFDESPFDRALDEALSDSLEQPFDADSTFEESIPEGLDDDLAALPAQIPDVYLDASSDDEFAEEFTFEMDETPLANDTNLTETDSFFDASLNDDLTEETIEAFTDQFADQTDGYMISAIAPELEITTSPVNDISEQSSTEFTFEVDESLSMASPDSDEVAVFSDGFFDNSPSQESDELISNPFDFSSSLQSDDPFASESQHQEISLLELPDEQLEDEDLSSLFNEINEVEENLEDQLEIEQNPTDSLSEQPDELDSIWQLEETASNESDFSDAFETSTISASENFADPFDLSINLQEESFVPESENALETDTPEDALLDLSEQHLDDQRDELSEDFSFDIEDNLPTDHPALANVEQLFDEAEAIESIESIDQGITESIDPFIIQVNPQENISNDDAFISEFEPYSEIEDTGVSTLTEQESETAFPSLFDQSEDLDEQTSELIWQTEGIESGLVPPADVLEDLSEVQTSVETDSSSSTFDLSDMSEIEEMDNGLSDQVFNFDTSNDFGALTGSIDEESPIDFAEGLLIDGAEDVSSIFGNNLEQEPELDYQEFINSSEANNLDIDENASTFEELTEDIGTDDESILFSEILEVEDSINNSMELEESVVFDAIAENLAEDSIASFSEFSISETSNLELDSESPESIPDLSLDFSDNWFDEVTDEDENSPKFASLDDEDISIGYPSEDAIAEMSDADAYGFADNLLDSLMDESDEKFDGLSMDLPDLETLPDFSNLNNDPFGTEDNENEFGNEPEFDFSAFDVPITDSVNTARAEIDDFLSGALELPEIVEENPKPKPQETTSLDADNNPLQTPKSDANET
jgi:methyl-accepting chemotaxis protein